MIRHYYQLEFFQHSPLRIGTGFGLESNSDVIRDRRGMPFLPGSSITGLLRCMFDPGKAEALFGFVHSKGEVRESQVLVSDGTLPDDAQVRVSIRDGVGLNERKTAKPRAKYDFQTVETDKPYRAVLELTDETYKPELDAALARWVAQGVSVGARTTRGYGRMEVSVRERGFSLPDDLKTWLSFDPFAEGAFRDCPLWEPIPVKEDDRLVLQATLCIQGSFSVRTNTCVPMEPGNTVSPDTVPMENREGKPVIPGTSWAGAFLHRMRALAEDLGLGEEAKSEIDALFGTEQEETCRSRICFSETALTDSQRMWVTRTAIERYTAAPRHRALFTSEVALGGTGALTITLPKDSSARLKGLLGAALCDLHLGLFGVGGENGIGRGAVSITGLRVNGADRTQSLLDCNIADIWKEDAQ